MLPGVRGEFIPLYAAAGQRGITPMEVDCMEVWQFAAMCGVGILDTPGNPNPGETRARAANLAPGVGDMRQGWIDPNVLQRAKRHMGMDAPDIELGSVSPHAHLAGLLK